MTSSFDPRHNSDPQVLNNILLVDQDTTLTKKQKPKKRSFLGKFFHWLTSPRERISHIREKFASFCNLSNEHEAKLDEVANIYANSRYFNERVITKHNISKAVSYLFFWNKVPLIDTKALEQHIRGILSEHATSIESAKSIPEKIQALHRASVALSGTQALKTFSESENDLGYLRQQLETRLTVKVKELKEEIQLITSKMTSSTQLSIEELQLLDKLDTLLPFLPESQDNNHKLIELINSKKRADNLFKRVCTELADTIDVTSQARELLTDKFLSQESKKILTELLDLQQFHIAACGLCQKAVRAEEKDLPILTAQHTKLGKAIPPRADTYHFDTAGNFIAQFEQLRTDLQEFKKKEKLPLNSESIALYQKILRTIQSQALLSKNPYVLKVQNEAREIYANMQDLSSTFTKLKNELTGLKDALLKNPEVVSKSNQKQSDWKELPDCDEKKELVALLQEYEELKSAAKPYLEAHKRLQEFETRIKAAGYTATQRDLEKLEQIKKLITNGPYLQPFQQAVTSVQTSLSQIQALANSLDAAHKIYTHLLQDASPNFHNVQESLAQIKRTIDGQPRIAHTEELRKRVESEIEKSQGVIKELVRAEKISLDLGPTFKSASKENATKAIELCRSSAQVEHPFVRAIVASCERYLNNPDSLIINELQKMAQTPDNYRSDLSLRFFTKQAGKASLYEQVQKARTTEDNRKLIDESMRKLFPEIVFKEAGFIEKCCKLWKSEEAPEFSQNELLLLETLAKTKGMPLQFALQFDLLKSMHEAKFHPRLKCPITHTTLIDLVATNDQPKHYYNGYAIRDWLATNPTSPMTRKPMTLHDVQANPQCSKLVHKWLMCKELMKPQPIEVANGPFAILSSCPEELKSIFKHYDRAGSIVWNRDHSPIRELLMSWARDGKSPLNAQWTSHLANTHMLAKSLIFDGFTPSSEAYEKRFLDYLQRAHTLVAYYDSLFLFIDRRLARDPNKKPFKDSIMLLRHILLQPDAFLEPAFTSTKEYLDRVIFGTNHLLYLLLDEIAKRGGNDPPNDIPPNVAVASLLPPVQWLYVATRIRSNLTKMQSVDDYHNYHQTLEKQCQETMSLRSFMERILLDAKAFIEMLVRYQHSFGHRLSASNTAAEIIREERQVGRQARMYG